jgi:flagellar protein FliO/FliZ
MSSVRKQFLRIRLSGFALLLAGVSWAVQAQETPANPTPSAPLFAAPQNAGNAAATPGVSMLQVTLSLAAVLAVVFAAAWLLRKMRGVDWTGNAQHLQVVAQVALGSKERAVLIKVHDVQVLVGVASGQVTALHTFGAEQVAQFTPPPPAEHNPGFKALFKKTLAQSFGWPK